MYKYHPLHPWEEFQFPHRSQVVQPHQYSLQPSSGQVNINIIKDQHHYCIDDTRILKHQLVGVNILKIKTQNKYLITRFIVA